MSEEEEAKAMEQAALEGRLAALEYDLAKARAEVVELMQIVKWYREREIKRSLDNES